MMKKEEAYKLKEYIAACDKAIFSEHPANVYVLNRRNFRGGNTIAQYFHDPVIYDGHLRYKILVLIFHLIGAGFAYFFLLVPVVGYTDSLKRRYRRNFLFVLHLIKINLRELTKQCYEVNKSCDTPADDLGLAFTAWHEVRHRVQMRKAFQILLPEEKTTMLRNFFKNECEASLKEDLLGTTYTEKQIPFEIDANYIAAIMTSYFKRRHTDFTTITPEQLHAFTLEYYNLMVWENPEINLDQ